MAALTGMNMKHKTLDLMHDKGINDILHRYSILAQAVNNHYIKIKSYMSYHTQLETLTQRNTVLTFIN